MGTKFAVVYGEKSKLIRRIISCEDDPHDGHIERATNALIQGEAIAVFNISDHPIRNSRAMQQYIGNPDHDGRCAVVDISGNVLDVIHADPDIDTHKLGDLVQHPEANYGPGWKYDGTNFIAPPSAPAKEKPAK